MPSIKDGIFRLHTRRFGTVAEILVAKLVSALSSKDLRYDLEKDGDRIECKFSRAQKESKIKVTPETVMEAIQSEANRDVYFDECMSDKWDCNFQQIKRKEFDILYYGIFFADRLVIYRIPSDNIDESIKYSDKQHRGNVGEGQFHITNMTMGLHEPYLYKILTYGEIERCLKLP